MKSYSQILEKNSSTEESLIFQNNNNNGKNKKNIIRKNRNSYSSLTTDTNNDKKIENEDYVNKLKLSLKLNDEIDYSKKIREAKEIDDLRKIYEKWSGQRFHSSNKHKNSDENEFIWLKKKNKLYNDMISNLKRKNDAKNYYNINYKYKNLLSENKKMKEELNKIKLQLTKLNKSNEKEIKKNKFLLNQLIDKPKIINLKKNNNINTNNLLFSPKKKENVFDKAKKILEENKLKEEIEKARLLKAQKLKEEMNKLKKKNTSNSHQKKIKKENKKVTFDEKQIKEEINKINKKNKSFSYAEKKEKEKEKEEIKNQNKNKKIFLDEKKIKEEINKINKKNKTFFILTQKNQKEKEKENEDNIAEEKKIQKEFKKLNDKNKIINEKQIYINRTLLESNKSKLNKEDISKANNESEEKLRKKEISEESNESVKEKLRKKENGIKIIENNDKEEKIKLKLKLINSMKKVNKVKMNNIDLKTLIKRSNVLSDKNSGNDNLVEKLDFILELNKYIKNEIQINKDNNLILPEEAVYYIENVIIRFLGYFGSELKLKNINTYIEKNPTNPTLRDITFKVISCGLATQKIYKLIIENDEIKEELSNNIDKYVEFLENIKFKIANKFNISENNIYFFGDNFKNFEIYLIIYNHNIDKVENLLKEFSLKVTTSPLLNNIILSPNVFEYDYSKDINDWPKKNLMRGRKPYNPPYGWIGIALKIKNKYGKNNIWIGKENIEGEWPVAYHGVGKGNILDRILNIINGNLDNEEGKLFKKEKNVEENNNKYPVCGIGVYLSPNIEEAEYFADETNFGFYNVKFKFVFMTRVNPNKIRSPGSLPVQWILNGNKDEIRPYRLLIKFV